MRPLPPAWAAGLLGISGLAALLAAEEAFKAVGAPVVYLVAERTSKAQAVALAVSAILLGAVAPASWRLHALVAVSAVAYPLLLGPTSALVLGYVLLVCALARTALRLRHQLVLALATWATVPVCRHLLRPSWAAVLPLYLFIVWTGLAYSTIYLLVERSRRRQKSTLVQELFYLIALPRLLCPFYQPISPGYLFRCDRPDPSSRRVSRAVALGAYAMLLEAAVWQIGRWWRAPHSTYLDIPAGVAWNYARLAAGIFTAASLFRLMGFDVASGFRQPFLARSFADFFARFNFYVRDAVLSLFYVPLFMRWRLRTSARRAAIAAAYTAIFLGSFVLNQVLVPVATNTNWLAALKSKVGPVELVAMLLFWTGIILPSAPRKAAHTGTASTPARPRWQVATFLVLYVGVWTVGWILRKGLRFGHS